MDDRAKARFSEVVGTPGAPKTVPDNIVEFWDDQLKICYRLASYTRVPREVWGLMVFLPQKFDEISAQLKELKDEVESLKSKVEGTRSESDTAPSDQRSSGHRPSVPPKIDGRSKAARALRAAQLVEA